MTVSLSGITVCCCFSKTDLVALGSLGNSDHNFSFGWNTVIWVRLPCLSSDIGFKRILQ